jgi:hypothetical protein
VRQPTTNTASRAAAAITLMDCQKLNIVVPHEPRPVDEPPDEAEREERSENGDSDHARPLDMCKHGSMLLTP